MIFTLDMVIDPAPPPNMSLELNQHPFDAFSIISVNLQNLVPFPMLQLLTYSMYYYCGSRTTLLPKHKIHELVIRYCTLIPDYSMTLENAHQNQSISFCCNM